MFKIRCSGISQIMTNSRSKTGLSETTKNYLKSWVIENKYNRKQEIYSDYLKKGIQCEEEGFTLACKVLKLGFVQKNQESFENNFLTGTPDLIFKDTIIDIKNSWNLFTFPFFDTDAGNNYYWQMQGYMALTGLDKAKVVFCLVNTPENLILNEAYKIANKRGMDVQDTEQEARQLHTFDDIPETDRIKVFDIYRNEDDIQAIYNRVAECREFINNFLK